MAEIVVNFLFEKLLQLLTEDVHLISGVAEEFQELLQQVRILRAFIDDFSNLVGDSYTWKEMDKAIRLTVYKTEDIIDKFLIMARLQQEKNILRRSLDLRYIHSVRGLSKNIKGFIEEMKQIPHGDRQAENIRLELESQKGAQDPKDFFLEDDQVVSDQVVGFDEEADRLIDRLIRGSEDLDVIPIVGMPGLGKTTLSLKIYNHPRISVEFFSTIWIHVGQLSKIKDIFLQILERFTKHIQEYQYMNANELAREISSFVAKGGKCLIVLDEVWSTDVVDSVMKVFPKNNKGHRIMITTRDKSIAGYACEDPHDLKFLTHDESFELLRMKVFGRRSCPDELIGLAKRIAKNCGGLPLSIVIVAGALRRSTNRSDWTQVEKNVVNHIINGEDPDSSLNFVKMSFDRLPQEMQSCFLYCGAFPRGFEIPVWKVIRLWIAEGLIKSKSGVTLEETAQYYLKDLVNRNLVMEMQKTSDGQTKTCRVQDLLHEFCKMEATRQWFFREVHPETDGSNISIHDPSTSRRLSIQSSALNHFLSARPFAEHVRSFYCFSARQIEMSPNNIKSLHKAFPLIRVLDVESVKFLFTKDFSQLFHLRYIAISGDFRALPMFFGKFWNLQTLILNTSASESNLEIKADIWNMLRLRHIHTNVPTRLPSPSASTGKGSSLLTLSRVAPESCKKNVLAKACNLRKLAIQGNIGDFLETSKGGWCNLEELKFLEYLKLYNGESYSRQLHLHPSSSIILRTLKKLTLSNTRFEWDEAKILGQFECLEVLKLKHNAFSGMSWKVEIGGFRQLQVLWIERADLKTWEASELPFPRLRHLVLKSCENLEAMPYELADVRSLQEMRLENTIKAVKSAKEIACKKLEISIKFKLSIFPPEINSEVTC